MSFHPNEQEEAFKNACFMAAAPENISELVQALALMVKAFNVTDPDPITAFAAIEKARALLAKYGKPCPKCGGNGTTHGGFGFECKECGGTGKIT